MKSLLAFCTNFWYLQEEIKIGILKFSYREFSSPEHVLLMLMPKIIIIQDYCYDILFSLDPVIKVRGNTGQGAIVS